MGDNALGNLLTSVAGNELTSLFREAYGKLDKLLADGPIGAIPKSTESSESCVAGRKLEFTGIRAIIALVSGGGGINASGNRRIEFQLKLGF